MPGIDKPTGRAAALMVLLIVVAAALRGYLPVHERAAHPDGQRNPAAPAFIVVALAVTLTLLAIAIIARLRDPRGAAPRAGGLSEILGTGRGRPSWRVLLIGLVVIVSWALIVTLLARLLAAHGVAPSAPVPDTGTPPPARVSSAPPRQPTTQAGNGGVLAILLAATVPMLLMIIAGTGIMWWRRWRAASSGAIADERVGLPPPTNPSMSLVRAAEVGLAEMSDLSREPRDAIIACYAAMERELANVAGAAPQDFDTPTEVLARAVEHHVLQADNAARLVNLFAEARFSAHVMREGHRDVAVQSLRLVLDELGCRSLL